MSLLKKPIPAEDRVELVIVWSLRALIVIAINWALVSGEWETFFISIMALVITFMPEAIKKSYKIRLPIEFDIIMVVFIFASVFLGEVVDAYENFLWWDAVLHLTSGIVLSYAGFLILYTLYFQQKLKAQPIIFAFFTFTTGLAIGAVWEIFEYTVDQNFGTNMQKSGLQDTMWDLIVDAFGAILVAVSAYYFIKHKKDKGLIAKATDRFMKKNPQFKQHWWKK